MVILILVKRRVLDPVASLGDTPLCGSNEGAFSQAPCKGQVGRVGPLSEIREFFKSSVKAAANMHEHEEPEYWKGQALGLPTAVCCSIHGS